MPTKQLTEIEVGILEELDAFNRARIRTNSMDFAAGCMVKGTEGMTGYDITEILKVLSRRGYIDRRPPTIRLTSDGLKQIKRLRVIHLIDRHGNRQNGLGQKCTNEKMCAECVRVAKVKAGNK